MKILWISKQASKKIHAFKTSLILQISVCPDVTWQNPPSYKTTRITSIRLVGYINQVYSISAFLERGTQSSLDEILRCCNIINDSNYSRSGLHICQICSVSVVSLSDSRHVVVLACACLWTRLTANNLEMWADSSAGVTTTAQQTFHCLICFSIERNSNVHYSDTRPRPGAIRTGSTKPLYFICLSNKINQLFRGAWLVTGLSRWIGHILRPLRHYETLDTAARCNSIIVGQNYFRLSTFSTSERGWGDLGIDKQCTCIGLFEGSSYYYLLWRADQFIDTLARAGLGAIRDNDRLWQCGVSSQYWSRSQYCRIPEVARFPMAGGQGGEQWSLPGRHWTHGQPPPRAASIRS